MSIEIPTKQAIELLEDWVKALKSGDYSQCKNRLRTDSGYCCLGVLCDIGQEKLRNLGFEVDWVKSPDDSTYYCFHWSDPLKEWSHEEPNFLPDPLILIIGDGRQDELSRLNDSGASFEQIADIVEKVIIPEVKEYA